MLPGASATVTVGGSFYGEPQPAEGSEHYATIDVAGRDSLQITVGTESHSPVGSGDATVNLLPFATLSGSFGRTYLGALTVNGGPFSQLHDFSGQSDGGTVTLHANITGTGTIAMVPGYPDFGGTVELDGRVGSGETADVQAGKLLLDRPMRFAGTIDWAPGGFHGAHDPYTQVVFRGLTADSYSLDGGKLHLFSDNRDFLDVNFRNDSVPSADFHVTQSSQGVVITALDPASINVSGTPLPLHGVSA